MENSFFFGKMFFLLFHESRQWNQQLAKKKKCYAKQRPNKMKRRCLLKKKNIQIYSDTNDRQKTTKLTRKAREQEHVNDVKSNELVK